MKTTDSRCKVNGLHVAEVTIKNMPGAQLLMDSKYALVVGTTDKAVGVQGLGINETHGQCSAYTTNWSETTMNLLHSLIDSMEQDLLPRHFEETAGLEGEDDERLESGAVEDAPQI